ncbi:MAG: hypothetical protein NC924_00540 [Candidatus Omnitrophica bacterium]|nr:hypothetical protein [Candidatus Omnitrophota bacterium]
MPYFTAKLIERIPRTPSVETFRFLPERGRVAFRPGQFTAALFDPENRKNRDLNKYLSFSSSPQRDYFDVTKRLSESSFSGRLRQLQPGGCVQFDGPFGTCVFQDEFREIAFIVGGIGITPVISMLEYLGDRNLKPDAVLLYSNRFVEEIAFRAELTAWDAQWENLRVVHMMTQCRPRDFACIHGYLDLAVLQKEVADCRRRQVFIFGPPTMVAAMKSICQEAGCPADLLKTEMFTGYE